MDSTPPITFLAVIDDAELLSRVRALFEHERTAFSLVSANSVAEGLVHLRNGLFHAVLLECRGGEEAECADLATLVGAASETPIVGLARIENPAAERAFLRAGVQEILLLEELSLPKLKRACRLAAERMYSERGRRFDEERERQVQKFEAIGKLAGGVAHEFNNLLMVILGRCELSGMQLNKPDALKKSLDEIRASGERAATLTRQLLAYSRRQVLQLKVLEVNTLIREMEKLLNRVLGEDIDLKVSLASDAGKIKADPGQIEQVLLSLVVYCRGNLPRSGGSITIETSNVDIDAAYAARHGGVAPGSYVMIAVGDNGKGLEAEDLQRVFDPFFTSQEQGKGEGLGLSVVYGIAKQSGGNVWAYSEPQYGTVFKLYLPRVGGPVGSGIKNAVKPSKGGETILVAEDEAGVRELILEILQAQGYRTFAAPNGQAALELLRRSPGEIQLLLTDLVMPQMHGQDLFAAAHKELPDLRVVFMSGYTDRGAIELGVLSAGSAYLQKPFGPDALARKVREVLDATPSR